MSISSLAPAVCFSLREEHNFIKVISAFTAMAFPALLKRCKRFSPLLAAPALLLLNQVQAKAVLNYYIFESGGNVVIRGKGSLALPGPKSSVLSSSCPFYSSSSGSLCSGPTPPLPPISLTYLLAGTVQLPGTIDISPNTSSGNSVGVLQSQEFIAHLQYTGGPITSESVFSGQTLASFGITSAGLIGTWTLQSNGSDGYTANDTINFTVGAPSVPGPLPLLGAGAAFGVSRRLRKRVAAPLSNPPEA